jgi:hypothetical protein
MTSESSFKTSIFSATSFNQALDHVIVTHAGKNEIEKFTLRSKNRDEKLSL